MAVIPPLVAFWAAYGTQIIISLSFMAVSMGLNLALSYLNRAKTHKSIFDSSTYHENGMINNIQPGTPKNIIYGEHRIPPSIINKYSYAVSDEHGDNNHTKTEILCSLGEETTGVWGIRVNDQSVHSAYKNGKGLKMWWAPGGRTNQLIYESRDLIKRGTLLGAVTAGYNKTIDFDYVDGNNKHPFQGHSDNEESAIVGASYPGYVLIYEDDDKDSYEMVRYEGIQANGGGWRLTGCRVVKDHANGSKISQEWQIAYKDDDTTPLSIMPPFGKNVTEQQDLNGGSGTVIDYDEGWCPAVTTNNKVRSFAVTVGWEKGLYGIDKKEGYEKKSCRYQIRWRKVGGSWATTWTWTPGKVLHDSDDTGLKLIIEKNAKYGYVVKSDGMGGYTYLEDFKENFGTYGLVPKQSSGLKKYDRYKLVFDGKKEGKDYTWTLPKQEDNSIGIEHEKVENTNSDVYRVKIKFDTGKEKYTGTTIPITSPVNFKITYRKGTANNIFEGIASPSNAVTAAYRLTHHLPDKEPLDYAKYEIQVRKLDTDIDNQEDGQNEMRWLTLQEMDNDALEYPYESLLGFRLKMNEKVNTTIENITCMTQGKAVIDVQNASNVWAASTAYSQGAFIRPTVHNGMYYRCRTAGTTGGSEPTWLDIGTISDGSVTWEIANRFSDNPLDICADIIMSKRYGRGKYLELTNDRITAFYDKLKPEAAFADEAITENSTQRKRFSLNFNLDFRGPLIDLLQSLGNTFRGKFYFDGEIPLCFIDRKKTPTAMFCMGNIVEDTYKPEALNLADNINRLQAHFLNKHKNYTQDTDEADIVSINSAWTVSRLVDKSISLYGLIKKWYVRKILNYMLRFAWYTRNSTSFQTTLDGISCDIGDTFYCHDDTMNLTAQSGRIIAVGSNYIDMDKAFTFVVATTYKALLRQSSGSNIGKPHSELTVDLTATGTGAQTRVYFTSSITSVSANSIYILGTGTYYMIFRCVQKGFRGNAIEIGALEYNEEVCRVYKNDTSDPAWTGDSDETINEKDTALPTGIVPPEIPQMVLVESRRSFGEVEVQIRPPYGSLEWSHANIYYQEEGGSDWTDAGQTRGEPKRIGGLRIGKEYDFKAISISPFGVANNNETTATITLKGDADIFKPNPVGGIQLIGNKGSETNVYGSDFEFKWNRDSKLSGDDSTSNYIKHAGLSNIYENLRYRVAVFFPNIPASVKHGNVSVKDKLAHEEIVTENHYRFRLAQNIEATKDLWKDYSTHASYATYYGNPQRVCRFVIQAINGYGNVSAESEVTLTNPAPDMQDENGNVITPEVKALKSAIRVKWKHPYKEYDISHFIIKYATDAAFTQNVKRVKVSSLINVDSSDSDVEAASYKTEIDGLDPKKTYYIKIIPHDTYGAGTASNTVSLSPGVSHDDDDDDIDPPEQVTDVALSINSNNNVVIKWNKPSGSHATDVIEVVVDWRASQFTGTPNLSLTPIPPAGGTGNIPRLAEVDQGYLDSDNTKSVLGEKKAYKINVDESESYAKNSLIIKGAKVGYTYFARVRFRNSSSKEGAWSAWTYNATAVTGLSSDDFDYEFKKYIFGGTFTSTDQDTVSWGTGTLQFKNTDGSTTDYSISAENTGNMTESMWIVWPGDAPNANTKFKALTSAQYLAATGKTPIAFAQPGDTGQKAFFARFGDKKEYMYNASFLAAGSVLTAHLSALSVEASKMNINGTLTMGHSSGAKMLFQDSSSVNRIKIAATNGGTPKLIVTKSGKNADSSDADDPNNLLFTTEIIIGGNPVPIETRSIVESGQYQLTATDATNGWGNAAIGIPNFVTVTKSLPSLSGTAKRRISGTLSVPSVSGNETHPLPYMNILSIDSSGIQFEVIGIRHDPTNEDIVFYRTSVNNTAVDANFPNYQNYYLSFVLEKDTLN